MAKEKKKNNQTIKMAKNTIGQMKHKIGLLYDQYNAVTVRYEEDVSNLKDTCAKNEEIVEKQATQIKLLNNGKDKGEVYLLLQTSYFKYCIVPIPKTRYKIRYPGKYCTRYNFRNTGIFLICTDDIVTFCPEFNYRNF